MFDEFDSTLNKVILIKLCSKQLFEMNLSNFPAQPTIKTKDRHFCRSSILSKCVFISYAVKISINLFTPSIVS